MPLINLWMGKRTAGIFDRSDYYSGTAETILAMTDLYKDGAVIPLGEGEIHLCRIKVRDKEHIRVYKKQNDNGESVLCMVSGIENNPNAYRRAAVGWLREYARVELEKRVRIFKEQMQVSVNRISIKEQKTRWGSCSLKGNLNFNWKLVLMPERIMDYVVVHELAHRKQMNHSPAFWREVELILPDYKERRQWLREHESEFVKY